MQRRANYFLTTKSSSSRRNVDPHLPHGSSNLACMEIVHLNRPRGPNPTQRRSNPPNQTLGLGASLRSPHAISLQIPRRQPDTHRRRRRRACWSPRLDAQVEMASLTYAAVVVRTWVSTRTTTTRRGTTWPLAPMPDHNKHHHPAGDGGPRSSTSTPPAVHGTHLVSPPHLSVSVVPPFHLGPAPSCRTARFLDRRRSCYRHRRGRGTAWPSQCSTDTHARYFLFFPMLCCAQLANCSGRSS
jgi:hypothetical protein